MPRTGPLNLITDVAGVQVGSAMDTRAATGVTVVTLEPAAVASVSILGGAPGTRDTAFLEPDMTVEATHAIVLAGGSAFGLDAAGGVQAVLAERGVGLAVGAARVPLVPQAIVFDLNNGGDKRWGRTPPYFALGMQAAEAAAQTLHARDDSWYTGANIDGKPRQLMPYAGHFGEYAVLCDEIAADGYRGFAIRAPRG